MSSFKMKPIKIPKKTPRHHPLTNSIRQKKRQRSLMRKSTTSLAAKESETVSCSSSLEAIEDNLPPLVEECNGIPSPKTTTPTYDSKHPMHVSCQDKNDIYDPAKMFPFSNKHEERQKTIGEESQQWESFFDPQHTFGSFQTTISKQPDGHFYQGKWPLEREDLMGMAPSSTCLFPTVPSPTLPNTEHLHTTAYEEGVENISIEILPCPSLSSFPKKKKTDNKRRELLSTIQNQVFDEKWNGTQQSAYPKTAKARLQRHLRDTAEKLKREMWMEPEEDVKEQRRNRPSFLLFAYGFLFPPLWILGAFYHPTPLQRTTQSKQIDLKWQKYSRNAFLIFLLIIVVAIVLILVLKPEAVGFRNSSHHYEHEDKIIF